MVKIDPGLIIRLMNSQTQPLTTSAASFSAATAATVQVFVAYTGSVGTLKSHGLQVFADVGGIATGVIDPNRIKELAELDNVLYIEGADPVRPQLDVSVREIRVNEVRRSSSPRSGAGVIVGIVDTGIDIFHGSFLKAHGTTRILWIWDQTVNAIGAPNTPKAPDEYPTVGVEYTQDHINAALRDTHPVLINHGDADGHGTHVAGIAAGDGSQPGACVKADTYIGVAPAADLIIVKAVADPESPNIDVNYIWGADYIFRKAEQLGKAAVVNLSLATHLGAHDGKGTKEQFLDALLHTKSRVIVCAAGNNGDIGDKEDIKKKRLKDGAGIHASKTVGAGKTVHLKFWVPEFTPEPTESGRSISLDLWYPDPGRLDVSLDGPVQAKPPKPFTVKAGERPDTDIKPATSTVSSSPVAIVSALGDFFHQKNHIQITIWSSPNKTISAGYWHLELHNTGSGDTVFDCWIDVDYEYHVTWEFDERVRERTIGIPGTAQRVITAGAYNARTGKLTDLSSVGPSAGGEPKPDICAPGSDITSAASRLAPGSSACCLEYYRPNSGTSMAAPHVAGVVALILEKEPDLTYLEVRDRIRASARPVGDGVTLPNSIWGYGKLDAMKAVSPASPFSPGPDTGSGSGSKAGTGGSLESAGGPQGSIIPPGAAFSATPWHLMPLVERLSRSALGQVFAALVSSHFDEVLRLVNHNRRVATMWHRMSGPAILREMLLDNNAHRALIPEKVGEQLISVRLARYPATHYRFGSTALRAAITEHQRMLLALPGASVADIETWKL